MRRTRTWLHALALALGLAAPLARADGGDGFAFGSYGRVGVGSDLQGATPEATNVVAHGTRVVEPSYVELELSYRLRLAADPVRIVITPALFGDPFHYTGDKAASLALRNLYAEVTLGDVEVWVGSRMVRGDDIYLLDYWPLDDVNLLGAGASGRWDRLDAAFAVGANRLLDPFQYQAIDVAGRVQGAQSIVLLDRQRIRAVAHAGYRLLGTADGASLAAKLYLEGEGLPAGSRKLDDGSYEALPADGGFSVGGQLTARGFAGAASRADLFARLSIGLTAYPYLAAPYGFAPDKQVFPDASELVIGLAGFVDVAWGGVMWGAYLRRFETASPDAEDPASGWEYILDARPRLVISPSWAAALDLSIQQRSPRGVSPTALVELSPTVVAAAPMLLLTPAGPGSFARPELRLVYRLAHLDDGARDLYPLGDPRRDNEWVHYLGVQAEWWWNSSYR